MHKIEIMITQNERKGSFLKGNLTLKVMVISAVQVFTNIFFLSISETSFGKFNNRFFPCFILESPMNSQMGSWQEFMENLIN